MLGEEIDADELAEEILLKYNMAFADPLTPGARERLRTVVVQVLVSYGATRESADTQSTDHGV